jgi:hypothetical protein
MGKPRHVAFFSQSFFIFYEFMIMPMIIFGRYYSGEDPEFQVMGDALKKICAERREARNFLGYFV